MRRKVRPKVRRYKKKKTKKKYKCVKGIRFKGAKRVGITSGTSIGLKQ